ncbi:MAG: family transcriptional regulator [Streptosporangiaceae bacterium]|nr:family transcriptional regulator [Streptosporangiaceae bacterium]
MTDDDFGATIAKRRLSRLLADLRTERGYTGNQVCDRLGWGRGKVGRFEANQWKRPEMSDIRDLLRLYKVTEDERSVLETLATLARTRAWWRQYGDVFDNEYPGFESDAARISVYLPLILPGLLQTQAYIEAHMHAGSRSPQWQERALEARLRRQRILDRTDGRAPELVAVVTEASLMYRWGTQDARRAQIAHLVKMSRRPNVELRMLRFADGPHPGMSSMISVFDFPGDEPSVVYLESDATLQELNTPAEVDSYIEIFGQIKAAALEPTATTACLKSLSEALE